MKRIITGVVDLRRKARFRSERISQLIFGEAVELLGSDGEYLRVVGPDKLEGYVLGTLVGDLEGERSYKLASRRAGDGLQLPFGSYLSEKEARRFGIPWKLLVPLEKSFEPYKLGRMFLGVPYLWGGTSDFGYDCSGFTQRLFRYSGIEIPRNSNWQRDAGQKVKDLDHARNGDLVFFRGHVAIYLGDGKIIHANLSHGGVSITDLKDRSEYSRVLMSGFQGVRRFEPS